MDTFLQDKEKGKPGVRYVVKHLNDIVQPQITAVKDTSDENIEGKDCVATAGEQQLNVEVKTIWHFIDRTNDDEEPSGTLPFELWSNSERNHPGWFIKMLKPDEHSVCPDILVFLLVAYENVFASIAFEDIPELIKRLTLIANEYGIDFDNIPYGDLDWTPTPRVKEDIAIFTQNVWLVPYNLLEDLATVTMIGDKPRIRPIIISKGRQCSAFVQELRYKRLTDKSEKVLPRDEEFIFSGDSADQAFAAIDYDLQILENGYFQRQCETLSERKGLVDSLSAILESMLAHEYPSKELDGDRYFPISYYWLQNWCESRKKKRAIQTWVSHVKFLLACGLLEYNSPPLNSKNPIDIMVNTNNTGIRSVGFYSPVRFTWDTLSYAEKKSLEYKLDKIPISDATKELYLTIENDFAAVDKQYGNDQRRTTKAYKYVEQLFFDTIISMIDQKGYALPDKVAKAVYSKMKRNLHFKEIDQNREDLSEEETAELRKQAIYCKKLNRMRKHISRYAKDYGLRYKQLSNTDKSWIEETRKLKTGTMVIIPQAPSWAYPQIFEYKIQANEKKNEKRRKKYARKKKTQ